MLRWVTDRHGHPQPRRHLADRLQHGTCFGVAVAVDLAEVGTDRIDDDQLDVADPGDRFLQLKEVRLEVEGAPALAILGSDRRNDIDLARVGSGRIEARADGVGCIVLRRQDDGAAERSLVDVARPEASGGDRRP